MLDPSETTRKASGASSLVCGREKPGGLRALLCGNLRIYGPPGPHHSYLLPTHAASETVKRRQACYKRKASCISVVSFWPTSQFLSVAAPQTPKPAPGFTRCSGA